MLNDASLTLERRAVGGLGFLWQERLIALNGDDCLDGAFPMAEGIHFTGAYQPAALPTLVPGGWYVGFACRRCGQHFAIMNALAGAEALELTGTASFTASCPNCEHSAEYEVADLVRFQAAQGGPSSTA